MKLFVLFTFFASAFALDSATVNSAKQDILDYLRDGGSPQKAVRLSKYRVGSLLSSDYSRDVTITNYL